MASDGTLGLVVRRQDDPQSAYLLSCMHVLDGGFSTSDVFLAGAGTRIATYSRSATTARADLDAAIAELVPDHGLPVSNAIFSSEFEIRSPVFWQDGMEIEKCTAGQWSRARLIRGEDRIGGLAPALRVGKHPKGLMNYAQAGDSGSVWHSPCNMHAIGMHCMGGLGENQAVAVPVKSIFKALRLILA